ncbi:MAG: hypothetical protein ACRDIB_12160, partial [Ardenticatenaceae bacterium]
MRNIRLLLPVFCAVLVAVLASTMTLRADAGKVNGAGSSTMVENRVLLSEAEIVRRVRHFVPEWNGEWSETVECSILGPNGNPRTTIPVTYFGDPAYYFFYTSDFQFANQVRFVAFPTSEGSPLKAIVQNFEFASPEDGNITTPFG